MGKWKMQSSGRGRGRARGPSQELLSPDLHLECAPHHLPSDRLLPRAHSPVIEPQVCLLRGTPGAHRGLATAGSSAHHTSHPPHPVPGTQKHSAQLCMKGYAHTQDPSLHALTPTITKVVGQLPEPGCLGSDPSPTSCWPGDLRQVAGSLHASVSSFVTRAEQHLPRGYHED